jgi:hypothetical protein
MLSRDYIQLISHSWPNPAVVSRKVRLISAVNTQSVVLVEITATQRRRPDVDYNSANTSMNSSSST